MWGPVTSEVPVNLGGPVWLTEAVCSWFKPEATNWGPMAHRPFLKRVFLERRLQQDWGSQSLERSMSAPSGEVCAGSSCLKLASLGLEPPLHLEAPLRWGRL